MMSSGSVVITSATDPAAQIATTWASASLLLSERLACRIAPTSLASRSSVSITLIRCPACLRASAASTRRVRAGPRQTSARVTAAHRTSPPRSAARCSRARSRRPSALSKTSNPPASSTTRSLTPPRHRGERHRRARSPHRRGPCRRRPTPPRLARRALRSVRSAMTTGHDGATQPRQPRAGRCWLRLTGCVLPTVQGPQRRPHRG